MTRNHFKAVILNQELFYPPGDKVWRCFELLQVKGGATDLYWVETRTASNHPTMPSKRTSGTQCWWYWHWETLISVCLTILKIFSYNSGLFTELENLGNMPEVKLKSLKNQRKTIQLHLHGHNKHLQEMHSCLPHPEEIQGHLQCMTISIYAP